MSERKCDTCKSRLASHYSSIPKRNIKGEIEFIEKRLCCKCYIKNGGTPSDWHDGCMEQLKEEGRKE